MALLPPREGTSLGFHVYPSVMDEGTLGDPEAIVWASIRHLCSRGVAEEVAALAHGVTRKRDRESVGRNLKIYIQQASEFYEAAGNAKADTAPLIYYYSFLNLAKALCELRHPAFHTHPECYRHGVSWRPHTKHFADPATDKVSVTTRGVWHVLWEALTRAPCPATNPAMLSVKHLFSYCPEIGVEVGGSLGGPLRLVDFEKADVLYDQGAAEVWLRFSIRRSDLKLFSLSAPSLMAQIKTPRSGYVEVKSSDRQFRAFQSVTPKKVSDGKKVSEELQGDILGLNVFTHLGREGKLQYFVPHQHRLPFRIPQVVVYYTILFWLGSLVRYDPHSVGVLKDSEHWMLIDGFMSQSRLWLLELFEWALYNAETTLWISR